MRLKTAQTEQQQTTDTSRDVTTTPRYDAATLQQVIGLAGRLQNDQRDHLTAEQIEEIGNEVGLDPAFVRKALARLTQPARRTKKTTAAAPRRARPIARAWWAGAWTLPFIGIPFGATVHPVDASLAVMSFFVGVGVYFGTGVYLSQSESPVAPTPAPAHPDEFSRARMLEQLFTLQEQLQHQRQRRAFLSVDVVGSTAMKQDAPELAAEYSFGEFQRWAETVIAACGGATHSAAGDGIMGIFRDDDDAVRAARRLQEGIDAFNADRNRLSTPFCIRCGVNAGEVPVDPDTKPGQLQSVVIDRAALLQKNARPGEIVVSAGVAAAALTELGNLSPLPEPVGGAPAFTWRASGKPASTG